MRSHALVMSMLLVVCAPAFAQKLGVEAGDVISPAPATAGITAPISGTFRIVEDPNGIVSAGLAGACLAADLTAHGIGAASCSTDVECNPRDGIDERLPEALGYCVDQRCWTRPGPASKYCLRSIDKGDNGRMLGALVVGRTYTLPVSEADVFGDGKPSPWRVHACLNPMQTAGCASITDTSELRDAGPIKQAP